MNKRSKIQNILLLLTACFSGLMICELIVAYPIYYFFKDGKTSFYNREAPNFFFKPDPILGLIPRENLNIKNPSSPGLKNAARRKMFSDFQTNKYGFRYSNELTKTKPIGETRVFSLGGSTTQGVASSNKMTYPQQLEKMIGDPNVRIINAGVGGYRSIHLLQYYKEVIREFFPDIITIYSGWNDYEDYMMSYWKPFDPLGHALLSQFQITQHPITRFALGHLILKYYYRLKNFDRVEIQTNDPRTIKRYIETAKDHTWREEYKTNIQDLISLAKSDGVIPVLINFPSPQFKNASLEVKKFSDTDLNMAGRWDGFVISLKYIRAILEELAKKNKIPLIDVNQRFEKENHNFIKKFSYFTDRMHLTPEGNMIIAETIAPSMKNILKIRNQRGLSF